MNTSNQVALQNRLKELYAQIEQVKFLYNEIEELISNIEPEVKLPAEIPSTLIRHIVEEINGYEHKELIADYSLEMDWNNHVSMETAELDIDELEKCIERGWDEMITKIEIMNSNENQE